MKMKMSGRKQELAALVFFVAIAVVVWLVGAPAHSALCHDLPHFH